MAARLRRLSGTAALACSACLVAAFAGAPPTSAAREAGLTTAAQALIDDFDLPGFTVAAADSDGVATIAVGLANREDGRSMTPESTMLAASIGKTFVAAIVLKLSEEGALRLDAPISVWLGDRNWFERLPNANTITIRHLLRHASGVPDHVHLQTFAELGLDRAAEVGPEGLIGLVLDSKPLFPAGEGWSYTDTGYLLLGLVIEAVTGQSYEKAVQARFLEPLGLTSTAPSNKRALPGLARGYVSPASGLGLPARTTDDAGVMRWDPAVEWTGGGLYSTSHDLAVWGRAFLSGRLLAAETYADAIDGVAASDSEADSCCGLGIAIRPRSEWGPVYGHRGWIPGYVSSLQYYPQYDTAIAFQTNTDVGIIDAETRVILQMEERLAAAIFGAR